MEMSEIILTDGSVLMNATFNDVRFLVSAQDRGIVLDSCCFNRCNFEDLPPFVGTCVFCNFQDCSGVYEWLYKELMVMEVVIGGGGA